MTDAKTTAIKVSFLSRDVSAVNTLQNAMGGFQSDQFEFDYLTENISDEKQLAEYNVLVSPANSFGELLGGIDMRYYMLLGKNNLQDTVYRQIKKQHYGEIPVGDYCLVQIPDRKQYLLMCPTMTIPLDVSRTRNAYFYMRAVLKALNILKKHGIANVSKVLCPIPCIGVGCMTPKQAARQIRDACDAVQARGIISAIHMTEAMSKTPLGTRYPHFEIGDVLKNAKLACIEQIN
jgi:O-acetyl-ADP-ribose deacetylase (regulator of RNase III)